MKFHISMIQRIQTVYLLLGVLCLGAQFITPYFSVPIDIDSLRVPVVADGKYDILDRPWLLYISGFSALMAIVAIFMFRNRVVQSRFTSVGIFSASVLSLYMASQFYPIATEAGAVMSDLKYRLGFFMPFTAAFMMWLANRAIRRDQMMIKSADRLR
ncbi:MAG: DUF4293 domain-containing protein [Saprospiraceae bacterium]|nr:DUF4293 domain-containing protein [Saprospiraceae bacterium]